MEYDVFISHASEDKVDVVRPLVAHLKQLGLKVWLDEFELTVGDSLRRSVDQGLSRSRFGAVVLSPAFFTKEWPNKELDGLVSREDGRAKVILPVWHNVGQDDIRKYSPTLAAKVAVSTSRGLEHVAGQIFRAISRAAEKGDESIISLGPSESQVLKDISQKMILARSSHELRRALYELEDYLAKYPNSPEARLLQHKLERALHRTEAMEPQAYARRKPTESLESISFGTLILFAVIGGILYLIYLLLKWLFS